MPLTIKINPGSGLPLYQQIVETIVQAIVSRKVVSGESLPSVRALAEELVINPNTVLRAYSDLSKAGFITGQPGRGYLVAEPRQIYSEAERLRRLDAALDEFLRHTALLGFSKKELLERLREKMKGNEG